MDSTPLPSSNQTLFQNVLLYLIARTTGKLDIGSSALRQLAIFVDQEWEATHKEHLFQPYPCRIWLRGFERLFRATIKQLLAGALVKRDLRTYGTRDLHKVVPAQPVDESLLPADVKQVVDQVLVRVAGMCGMQIARYDRWQGPRFHPVSDRIIYVGTAVKQEAYRLSRCRD